MMLKEEAAMFFAMEKLEEFKAEWCKKADGTYRCEYGCPFADSIKCTINVFITKAKNYIHG